MSRLSQGVLLSLLQQLGSDLPKQVAAGPGAAADLALCLQWLREATTSVDPRDPLLGLHVPAILGQLRDNLAGAAAAGAGGRLAPGDAAGLRMAQMLVQGLLSAS